MKLKDKVAIITGGSRGIGKAIAESFAREGAKIVILARDRREISATAREIANASGVPVMSFICDVSDAKAVRASIESVGKRFGRIDVLVNCAGIQAPIGAFMETKNEDWERNIAVNLHGAAYAIKAAVPFMKKGGSIINFSGGGATGSRPNFSAYAVAKTGIVKLTEILAEELRPKGIRVNAVAPGAVNTAMLTEVLKVGARAGREELAAAKKRRKEGGVNPEVPASLAVFLASDESAGLTGRLISAPWDSWKSWNEKEIKKIMSTEALTLRRVPPPGKK